MGRAVLDVPVGYRAGGWEVAGHIASGSWGSVYAAHRAQAPRTDDDPPEGTEAALKVIPSGTLSWPQYAQLEEAVREEVRFNDQADHPLLVHTFETFVVDDRATPTLHGAVVVAMERAERDLAGAIGDLLPDDAARIVAQMCAALTYIHTLGWVHGDLKPQNVLLMHDGSVRLADFGLARELEGTHAYAPRMGSSDFLPPEWWSERIAEHGVQTRPTADIWALGVTIHQLLTGGLFPFAGAGPRARQAAAQAYADGDAPLRLADELPPAWRPIVADCLAPDHEARLPHTAASLLARVEALGTGERGTRSGGAPWRRPPVLVAAAVAACAGVAAGAMALNVDSGDGAAGAAAAVVSVFNAEAECRESQRDSCRLGLARDPYARYESGNVVTRVRHGDRLVVECTVPDGWSVTAEDGRSSGRWYRVRRAGEAAWLPAVRIAPGANPVIGRCTDGARTR